MKIIGITGTLGSGKGTAAACLEDRGFRHLSARAFITKEVEKRGLPVNRDTLTETANKIREKHGPGYIIKSLYEEALKEDKDTIIESIRTPGEVAELRKNPNFYLIAIDATPEIRYDRIKKRASETDHISFDKFLADEQREMENEKDTEQNIAAVMKQADYTIINNKHIADFYHQLTTAVEAIQKKPDATI